MGDGTPLNTRALIEFAISDPGAFVKRRFGGTGEPMESVTAWGARAVEIALADRLRSKEDAGRIAMLEDAVVGAATLWFEEEKDASKAGYLSECLHETASEIVRTVPRLAGAYKGADQ